MNLMAKVYGELIVIKILSMKGSGGWVCMCY